VLFAILVCSSEGDCDAVYEAWGLAAELESLCCELCGCALQAVAFSHAADADARRALDVHLRDAA
jgi:hypothetical protein